MKSSLSLRHLLLGLLAALAFSLTLQSTLHAAQPQVSGVSPAGMQRGTEATLVLTGARVGDAKEILLYSPGVTVQSLAADADNKVTAKLTVAPDCRLGIHAFRLRTATGVSNLRTFMIGYLPETEEKEPNNDFAQPQPISGNVTINGSITNEDVDYYVVELKKGDRLTAEIEGLRLGSTVFDPYVAILNPARFELSRSDDAPLLHQDCLCSLIAPEDGKYIVQVRESSFVGTGSYRLHLGNFPRPTAVYPPGGKPGETLQVRWIGDAGGEWTSQVTLPTTTTDEEAILAQDDRGFAPSMNPVRVVDLTNYLEAEPNDAWEQASAGGAPGAMNGIIEKDGDTDFFKFTAKKGEQYDIRVHARKPIRSPLDSVLFVHNAKGSAIANNDDSGGPDSYLRLNVPADGDYFVSIRDQLKSGGPNYVYRIEISPVKPAITMVLPEKVQYISTTLAVPRGNRMALMVNATRANFGGDLAVEARGLPPGMTFETIPMTGGRADVPVIFTAAADAAPAGALAGLVGKSTDPKVPLEGGLNQRTMLLRGQNNVDVWGHDADRMAVVLTDEVPFKIELVQPKAPLVRNGSLPVKVVATRADGFTAPINVRLLYNPPGVSSSASISIPEGQTEALIPITAGGNAAIGPWKIVALGTATVGNGAVEVATQFADLNVSDQFFKFTFNKTAVEQGQATDFVVKVEKLQDFEGTVKAELAGLPVGATTEPVEFTKDATELVFNIKTAKDARVGRHTSVVCVATLPYQGETVTHTLGSGELRIDAPLPPKPDAKPAAATAGAKPAPAPEKKRLSRLEQLRLEREQNKK